MFDTNTGDVLQDYITFGEDPSGSYSGITYSADGKYLVFSQDSSNVTIAKVTPQGLLTRRRAGQRAAAAAGRSIHHLLPEQPSGRLCVPCGTFYSPSTSYPGGVALSPDGQSAYALLNQNDTLTQIDLTTNAEQGTQIRVGNAPHSIVIASNGTTAYVSNEGGRAATQADFQIWSAGTEIVADPVVGAAVTGTVSVVDLPSMTVTANISTGLHPTGIGALRKVRCWSPTPIATPSRLSTRPPTRSRGRSTLGCRSEYPAQANRPTAPRRTRSPSMPRTALPTSRFTMPTRSGWSNFNKA